MKTFGIILIFVLLVSCNTSNKEPNNTTNSYTSSPEDNKDSLQIVKSDEYLRVIAFLNWYKNGYDELNLSQIETFNKRDSLPYAFIDTIKAKKILIQYRNSGFFSDAYIKGDSLYIEKAKEDYKNNTDIDEAGFFNYDFILLTQETEGTLNAIPDTYLLPKYCQIKSGKIAVSIGDYKNLRFKLIKEDGKLKIDDIENLGLLR